MERTGDCEDVGEDDRECCEGEGKRSFGLFGFLLLLSFYALDGRLMDVFWCLDDLCGGGSTWKCDLSEVGIYLCELRTLVVVKGFETDFVDRWGHYRRVRRLRSTEV